MKTYTPLNWIDSQIKKFAIWVKIKYHSIINSKIISLQQENASLKRNNSDLVTQLKDLKTANNKLVDSNASLERENTLLRNDNGKSKTERESLTITKENLESELEVIKKERDQLQENMEEVINERNAQLKKELTEKTKSVTFFKGNLETSNLENIELKKTKTTLEEENKKLRAQINELEDEIIAFKKYKLWNETLKSEHNQKLIEVNKEHEDKLQTQINEVEKVKLKLKANEKFIKEFTEGRTAPVTQRELLQYQTYAKLSTDFILSVRDIQKKFDRNLYTQEKVFSKLISLTDNCYSLLVEREVANKDMIADGLVDSNKPKYSMEYHSKNLMRLDNAIQKKCADLRIALLENKDFFQMTMDRVFEPIKEKHSIALSRLTKLQSHSENIETFLNAQIAHNIRILSLFDERITDKNGTHLKFASHRQILLDNIKILENIKREIMGNFPKQEQLVVEKKLSTDNDQTVFDTEIDINNNSNRLEVLVPDNKLEYYSDTETLRKKRIENNQTSVLIEEKNRQQDDNSSLRMTRSASVSSLSEQSTNVSTSVPVNKISMFTPNPFLAGRAIGIQRSSVPTPTAKNNIIGSQNVINNDFKPNKAEPNFEQFTASIGNLLERSQQELGLPINTTTSSNIDVDSKEVVD